jgi:hypothetical protein
MIMASLRVGSPTVREGIVGNAGPPSRSGF